MSYREAPIKSATLIGAYGQDYSTRAEALAAWDTGKDFEIHILGLSTYCSVRDVALLKQEGFTHLTFRSVRGRILVNVPIK